MPARTSRPQTRPIPPGLRYASPEVLAALPQATILRIEARGEFHRMDPMEVVASQEEVEALLSRYPTSDYLLFPEDRTRPIRMPDDLPLDWVRRGPSNTFRGEARPNEWYAFQIGVWAARATVRSVKVLASDLRAAEGRTIPASRITCINTEGKDWLGRDMQPDFSIGKGMVRPLWFLVDVPADASGTYEGTVTIAPANLPPQTVQVQLTVRGEPLRDHGVSDLWRMSRLMWLNSGLGLADDPIPPYTPLKIQGDRVSCLGRTVRFGPEGLPAQISAKRFDILASPMRFLLETEDGHLAPTAVSTRTLRQTAGKLERETVARLGTRAHLTTRMRMEFDGCVSFETIVHADEPLKLRDIRLEIPVRAEAARYLMGFGVRGGFRKGDVRWKWNVDRADNQVWVGDVAGGLQLTLQGPRDVWDVITLREAGLPPSWHNDGKGGCDVVQAEGGSGPVVIRAYSGERSLREGEEVTFRYRLLITPFRPLDRRHWSWRYGPAERGGNILHIHHGTPGNSYINYPFLETDVLRETVQRAKNTPVAVAPGRLRYPVAGVINLTQGAMHIWVSLRFDPTKGEAGNAAYNQSLMSIELPNHDQLALYWNIDVRGLRAYVRKGTSAYPTMVDAPLPEWREGQTHLLTLSWGPQLSIYVDGKLRAQGGYAGLEGPAPAGSQLVFSGGGFGIRAIKVASRPHDEAETPAAKVDGNTLLLDTFEKVRSSKTQPLAGPAGNLSGSPVIQRLRPAQAGLSRELRLSGRSHKGGQGVNLYYTVRELSNHVAEMWALRSLGDEVFQTRETFIYAVEKAFFGQAGGGYPWLQEHLVSGYVPAWRQPLPNGETDAAIATQGLSRWHNYYVEGMRWLMENVGIDGLYLDGIGYDREIMKRIARVMYQTNPNYRINFHSGDNYVFMNWRTSPANSYMEHFPYISNLWFGELYDYDLPPDVWLVEISGIPFGLTSEMLNYETGGNPYRGMVFGMTGRFHPSAPAMWRFWDEFGIERAEWLGWWSSRCPVRTDRPDVSCSVYRRQGKSLIALGHWPAADDTGSTVFIQLQVDWKALGLDPARVRIIAPAIDAFQAHAEYRVGDPIPIERGKGCLLMLQQD